MGGERSSMNIVIMAVIAFLSPILFIYLYIHKHKQLSSAYSIPKTGEEKR